MNRFLAVVAFIALFAAGCGQSRTSEDVLAPGATETETETDAGSDAGSEEAASDEPADPEGSDPESTDPSTPTTLAPFSPPTTGLPDDPAVTVDFGTSTWQLTHGELNALVVPTWENEDFVNLVFRGVPPVDFTQTVLNENLFAQVVEVELLAAGGEITDEDLAESEASLLTQVESLYPGSADPAADAAGLYAATPYLPFLVRYQAAQNALTALLAETADPADGLPCVSHILVETEVEATAALTRLEAGEEFAALAIELSTGPSGPGGGDLGCADSSGYVPEFAAAVDSATVGEAVGPVRTEFGFHVLVVNRFEVDGRAIASERLRERAIAATVEVDEKLGTWDSERLAIVPVES